MKKNLLFILAVIMIVPFAGCGAGAKDKTETGVHEWIAYSAFCAEGDTIYNTTVSGGAFKTMGCRISFNETGSYIFTHADGTRTEITVKDQTPPQISVDTSAFFPQPNIACALPKITVTDGYDGIIENYEVKIEGKTAESVTFTDYGSKKMTVTATDKSGNKASKVVMLECVPPTDVAVPVGTSIVLDESFFYRLEGTGYNYRFTVTKIYGTDKKVMPLTKSFTVEKDCCYEVKGVATDGFGDKTEMYKLYYDENISVITFNPLGNGVFLQDESDFCLQYSGFETVVKGNKVYLTTKPAYARVEVADGGNGRLALNSLSEIAKDTWAWQFALKGEHRAGNIYFDLLFAKKPEGENPNDLWLFEIIKNQQIFYSDAGRYCVHVEADRNDVSYRFGVNGPKLTDNAVILDNILFVPD